MLVLSRRVNETIVLGDDIRITVLGVDGGVVRLGVEAPPAVKVLRQEVLEQVKRQNQESASVAGQIRALQALRRSVSRQEGDK